MVDILYSQESVSDLEKGNDLYLEMTESGVINKAALIYGQMNEPPGARLV